MADGPVDAGDHRRVRPTTDAIEHADGNERDSFGHAVGVAANGSGNVRAVTIAIGGVARHDGSGGVLRVVDSRGDATAKVRVVDDAGIDHVGVHAGSGGTIDVVCVEGQGDLVDAVETPRWIQLIAGDRHDAVGFDGDHGGIQFQLLHLCRVEGGGVAGERSAVSGHHAVAEDGQHR